MRTNNSLTLCVAFFMLMQFVIAQKIEEKEIRGKISVDSSFVEGINIVNSSSGKAAISDKNGNFSIVAKEGDFLIFSAINLESFRRRIHKQDLISDLIRIQMTPRSTVLKEVIVNQHPEINAISLGISPYGQKKYTAAERKLYTATSGGGIDGLLNKISGRTAMLKKELVVEGKEQLLSRIDILFEDKYYIETLKIPVDYIKGFQYYCIDDASFAASIRSKNKTMTLFLIVPLSEKYNQIITNEN